MDQRSQEELQRILAKEQETLTKEEIGFLRARRDYLNKAQLEDLNHILNPKVKSQTSKKESAKEDDTKQTN
jgi:hypothetical protein